MTNAAVVRLAGVCLDCADADELAAFYGELLGWPVVASDGDQWRQLSAGPGGLSLNIQGEAAYVAPVWPERAGAQQKMMHLEIEVEDLDAAVRRAVRAGGREAPWQPPDRDPARLRVLLDPAGHPLCLFLPGE